VAHSRETEAALSVVGYQVTYYYLRFVMSEGVLDRSVKVTSIALSNAGAQNPAAAACVW
jgi:hypothetical protein